MKLHHLHVAQRQARGERHGQSVTTLVAGRRIELVHRGPAAGGEQHRPGAHENVFARAHVDE